MLFTCIHPCLASFSVLFKYKSFLLLSLLLLALRFNILVGTSLHFYPNFRYQPWGCTYFGAKLAFIAGIFLKKYAWWMKIDFQFYFFAIWIISASILSIIAWKPPGSSLSPLEISMFCNIDPRCFGPFDKFHDTKKNSM